MLSRNPQGYESAFSPFADEFSPPVNSPPVNVPPKEKNDSQNKRIDRKRNKREKGKARDGKSNAPLLVKDVGYRRKERPVIPTP